MMTTHKDLVYTIVAPSQREATIRITVPNFEPFLRTLDDYWGWSLPGHQHEYGVLDRLRLLVTDSASGRRIRIDAEVIGRRVHTSLRSGLRPGLVLRRVPQTRVRELRGIEAGLPRPANV